MVTRPYAAITGDRNSSWLGQFSGSWSEDYLEPAQPTTDLLALLQHYGMAVPLRITVSSTHVFSDAWTLLREFDVTSPGAISGRLLAELGWSLEEALETRRRLRSFEKNWNAPAMETSDDERTGDKTTPFWTSLPLEKLAEMQGVQPVGDLDEISALWPVDDDPDQMLAHILEERASRRGLARKE